MNILSFNSYPITFNNEICFYNTNKLRPYTMRFKFDNQNFDPHAISGSNLSSKDYTWNQVDSSENIWDFTCEDKDWSNLFNHVSGISGYFSIIDSNIEEVSALDWFAAGPYSLYYYNELTSVNLNKSNCSSYKHVFDGCFKLQNANLDLNGVSNIDNLFYKCNGLRNIELLDTSNVTSMLGTFESCTTLSSMPLFDTSNVTNMDFTFDDCRALSSMPLFDMSNVTSMNCTFRDCLQLSSMPLLDVSNVTSMKQTFRQCIRLKQIPDFTFSNNLGSVSAIFENCSSVTAGTFETYNKLKDLPGLQSLTAHSRAFNYCGNNELIPSGIGWKEALIS